MGASKRDVESGKQNRDHDVSVGRTLESVLCGGKRLSEDKHWRCNLCGLAKSTEGAGEGYFDDGLRDREYGPELRVV